MASRELDSKEWLEFHEALRSHLSVCDALAGQAEVQSSNVFDGCSCNPGGGLQEDIVVCRWYTARQVNQPCLSSNIATTHYDEGLRSLQ